VVPPYLQQPKLQIAANAAAASATAAATTIATIFPSRDPKGVLFCFIPPFSSAQPSRWNVFLSATSVGCSEWHTDKLGLCSFNNTSRGCVLSCLRT